jgi:hypothetical protein
LKPFFWAFFLAISMEIWGEGVYLDQAGAFFGGIIKRGLFGRGEIFGGVYGHQLVQNLLAVVC